MADYSRPVRLFIAIKPTGNVLQKLVLSVAPMKAEPWAKQVRWIDPDNIHLTLRFLGNSDADVISDLCVALESRLLFNAIDYEITEITVFPSARKPSVIAALVSASRELTRLAGEVEEIVREFGYRPETKRFRGHFTVGRCRRGFPGETAIPHPIKPITGTATEIILYASATRRSGAVYAILARIGFVGRTGD